MEVDGDIWLIYVYLDIDGGILILVILFIEFGDVIGDKGNIEYCFVLDLFFLDCLFYNFNVFEKFVFVDFWIFCDVGDFKIEYVGFFFDCKV